MKMMHYIFCLLAIAAVPSLAFCQEFAPSRHISVKNIASANLTASTKIDAAITQPAEQLSEAVIRINGRLGAEYSPFAPNLLTVRRLQAAIETTIDQIASSKMPSRAKLVSVLTEILNSDSIPKSVSFELTPITSHNLDLESKLKPNQYINSISLNFTLVVPTGPRKKQMIGLPGLCEVFHIVRPSQPTGDTAAEQ